MFYAARHQLWLLSCVCGLHAILPAVASRTQAPRLFVKFLALHGECIVLPLPSAGISPCLTCLALQQVL